MNQSNFSVSVIIPVHNGEEFLRLSVKSVLNQIGEYVKEIIIVDDGSKDKSWSVMQRLSSEDKRIKIYQQKNQGQAKARNYGVSQANGEYLAFLDVDDTWKIDKLEKQMSLFHNNDELVLVYSNAEIIFLPPKKEKIFLSHLSKLRRGKIYSNLIYKNFIFTSSVIIKKNVFNTLGGFKEGAEYRYIEDYDLWLRAASIGQIDYCEEPLINYLRHASSSSQAKISTAVNVIKMLKKIPTSRDFNIMNRYLAFIRHGLVLLMYFFHLDRFFSPLD